MNPREQAVIAVVAAALITLLVFHPFDDLASFNPVKWVADSINGFLKLLEDLFFGWMK